MKYTTSDILKTDGTKAYNANFFLILSCIKWLTWQKSIIFTDSKINIDGAVIGYEI